MVRKFTPIADGGRKDKGTGKAKNVVGAKPKVYGNSNYKPTAKSKSSTKYSVGPGESYDGVRWEMAPKTEREQRKKNLGPIGSIFGTALDVPTALWELSGSRKNIIYRQGKTPTKRQSGK